MDGWHADAAFTAGVGAVAPEAAAADRRRRGRAGRRHRGDGARPPDLSDIGAAVQGVVEAAGFGVVRDYCGHGIGRAMHERPDVPELRQARPGAEAAARRRAGGGADGDGRADHRVEVLDDGWSVVTRRRLAGPPTPSTRSPSPTTARRSSPFFDEVAVAVQRAADGLLARPSAAAPPRRRRRSAWRPPRGPRRAGWSMSAGAGTQEADPLGAWSLEPARRTPRRYSTTASARRCRRVARAPRGRTVVPVTPAMASVKRSASASTPGPARRATRRAGAGGGRWPRPAALTSSTPAASAAKRSRARASSASNWHPLAGQCPSDAT